MVVSLTLPHSIFLGICKSSSHCGETEVRKSRNATRYGLKSGRRLESLRRKPQYVLLACVASGRKNSAGESWSFKTTAALVQHSYRNVRDKNETSELEVYEEKGGGLDSNSEKGGGLETFEDHEEKRGGIKDFQQKGGGLDYSGDQAGEKNIAVASTSSSWDSGNSARMFGTSRFGVLLGVVLIIFASVTLAGVAFGRWWNWMRMRRDERRTRDSSTPVGYETPSAFSFFLKRDLKRKESVEWVNMILGKLWKVYRRGLETWLVGLLQPLIDNLQKPSYVRRVEIQDFYLGDEPLSVRSVERRTSRRADDLQYQIGLRYTGKAKMLLAITLSAGFVPVIIPVGVRGLDVDGEIWVKLRLIPSEPWVGTATWAFVSLPKIILALTPFRLMNIMTIPFVSRFLTKLLTEDLPQLFVKPNKIVVNFLNNPAMNPFAIQFRDEAVNVDTNKDFAGELSVTLVDARKLKYFPIGKTDPYVVLTLGDQEIRSKKNSQTSIIGPPGAPIWNQDFQLLVADPSTQKLAIRVRDVAGLGLFTVGHAEVDLSTLQDTVPTDKIVPLRGGWGLSKRFAGEILLRLTYKAYVEDEDEDGRPLSTSDSDSESEKEDFSPRKYYGNKGKIGFLNDLFSAVNTVIRDLGYENVSVQPKQPDGKPAGGVAVAAENEPSNNKESKPSEMKAPANAPALEKGIAAGTRSGRSTQNSAVLWLGLATGIVLLTAVSLNFSGLIHQF